MTSSWWCWTSQIVLQPQLLRDRRWAPRACHDCHPLGPWSWDRGTCELHDWLKAEACKAAPVPVDYQTCTDRSATSPECGCSAAFCSDRDVGYVGNVPQESLCSSCEDAGKLEQVGCSWWAKKKVIKCTGVQVRAQRNHCELVSCLWITEHPAAKLDLLRWRGLSLTWRIIKFVGPQGWDGQAPLYLKSITPRQTLPVNATKNYSGCLGERESQRMGISSPKSRAGG